MAIPPNFVRDRGSFIGLLLRDLEKPYRGFLTSQLNEVIGQNEARTGAPCYMIGDTVYARGLTVAKIGKYKLGGMATLDPDLQPAHDDWLDHYQEHQEGWQRFSQSLSVVLMASKDWQELRDMLPEHVYTPTYLNSWGFQGLTRTRPDLHACAPRPTILPEPQPMDEYLCPWHEPIWDEKLVLQYAAISDKVDLYVGYRLL